MHGLAYGALRTSLLRNLSAGLRSDFKAPDTLGRFESVEPASSAAAGEYWLPGAREVQGVARHF
jgi:hypothetical protein